MNHFLVVFHTANAQRWQNLVVELRASNSWWNQFPGVWVVCTMEDLDQIYARCAQWLHLQQNDGDLLWIRFQEPVQANEPARQAGWLPEGAWNWLLDHHMQAIKTYF